VSDRGRVCFHAGYLYPLFTGGRIPMVGGAETQQALLARGLARRGFEVSAVVYDYGQPPSERLEGITFHRTHRPHGGVPVLRFFHPRLTRTVAALRRADAEVYYVRGAGLPAGIAWDVARARRAGLVLGTAHDGDARGSLDLLASPRDRWWYRRALRGADRVIAQTALQQSTYREELGRESVVIPNAVTLPPRAVDAGGAGAVVWLGTYKPSKRPEWVIAAARANPSVRFVMCGLPPVPPDPQAAWEAVQAAARELRNLEVRGFLPHERRGELFETGALFLHTSGAEGFPNTLLEAWACGLPSIAAVDPDGLAAAGGFGQVVRSEAEMAAAVGAWMADPARRREAGRRARAGVAARFDPELVTDRFAALLDEVVAAVRARRRPRARAEFPGRA